MEADAPMERFRNAGQGHVFQYFCDLQEEEKKTLLLQAEEIDLEEVSRLSIAFRARDSMDLDFSGLKPAPYIPHPASGGDEEPWVEARALGEEALRAGRVAAFTVAGGQGTRLGFDGPKGTFPATPVMGKSLFQVFAEKIFASGARFGGQIQWLIMTSVQNDKETRQFFETSNYFGLEKEQVHFFTQGLMPAVDGNGKILMSGRGRIAMNPDGHGGSLRALVRSGNVERLRSLGVDTISYFQVDNPLVQCIDPGFIGFHLGEGADISSKMVPKAHAHEKVGHFCVKNGRQVVVEYSDLPGELQEKINPRSGELLYIAGSIAIHILSLDFAARVGGGAEEGLALPFHFAHKKVPCIDEAGNPVQPMEPNGVKFEMFIFDSLPLAGKSVIIETRREDEFSPIKNAQGEDSAETSKRDQSSQFLRWLASAGENVSGLETVEVSPVFAQTGEEFAARWRGMDTKPSLQEGIYFG